LLPARLIILIRCVQLLSKSNLALIAAKSRALTSICEYDIECHICVVSAQVPPLIAWHAPIADGPTSRDAPSFLTIKRSYLRAPVQKVVDTLRAETNPMSAINHVDIPITLRPSIRFK